MTTELTVALVSSVLTAVIGPIAVHLVKERSERRKKDVLKESLIENNLVLNKLEYIKELYGADRVWIEQFHNGGNFYPTGKSIQKFSMCYEIVEQGTESIQQNFQNIPISLFSKSINQLLDSNIIAIPDFKNETVSTYGLKYVAEENKCKSAYMFAIKSIDNKFIGILGVDFVKRKTILSTDDVNELFNEATSMGGVLHSKN
jgi:hypothetical protein